ncbi:MAG: ABC transporter ATP-binding protein [Elusimicrobia bacterium GWA2_69_24]|nr:MAG: ABC transporter ATP-binding protein [Candidatus Rokubacteria bacterium RBG_16_73_20]OGR61041.1 MAG: ABC transporter ATP-binding protein [Elusimicrobia bacterium GWA2_69_24]HBH04913.1 ABC transporter ATP-binding protein [Candidatus Rokubacteria bacterium]
MTALLETRAISKRFGGLEAVSGVDLRLERGEVRALIGPNGAGKTTLVSLISGRLSPTSGRVLFAGRDITSLRAWDRVGLGIVYTFQVTSIYRGISVYDNVALAAQRRHLRALSDWIALDRQAVARDVEAALVTVGLWALRDQPARALAYGHQRLLEVAMALALGPELLVLDEPTQGLAAAEIDGLCGLVRDVARAATVLVIEHNMAVVLALAGRVTVMDQGRIIAEGTPREIEAHAEVQKAYLGR